MKGLVEFLKTTLIGGLLIVVPMYLSVLLLAKALGGLVALLAPIVALLPQGARQFGQILAMALVVLLCFVLGLIARTGLGRRVIAAFERRVLERMPGAKVIARYSPLPPRDEARLARLQRELIERFEANGTPQYIPVVDSALLSFAVPDLSAEDRAVWDAAVEYYDRNLADRDLLTGMGMARIKMALASEDLASDAIGPALRAVLERVAPIYRQRFWSAHDRSNREWIQATADRLRTIEKEIVSAQARMYGRPWFDAPVRVDIVWIGLFAVIYLVP